MFSDFLGLIMRLCYNLFNNYGIAILLFTLISKFILLPLSIWVQKNSIKMVKMQPKINQIKIDYFGDKDKIADEESKLYKEEKYNAFLSLIPLAVQIILLLGLVKVINHPLTYILQLPDDTTSAIVDIAVSKNNLDEESSSLEIAAVKDIKNDKYLNEYQVAANGEEIINQVKDLNLTFLGFDLSLVAVSELGIALLVPLLAGLSALILCIAQNKINVLQAEQSNWNKYGMLAFSVGLSLYLGSFVPAGVALYWIFSNLFAIIQQWLLNIFISPKKYIDYETLEKTSKELRELNSISKKHKLTRIEKAKARADYKRFFKVVNKHLVFYSESNGFYKYYRGVIEYILDNTNLTIHYITSDYNDKIFELEKENSQIKAYFIDEKRLITLMMKMDADVVVMTMPDLDTYHIKRSYLRKDIEYVYIPHGMDSNNLTLRTKALNAFDTVFASGKHQYDETIAIFKMYNLENRKVIKWGYTLLDEMIKDYQKNKKVNKIQKILIAPSWQKDNIIDSCLEEILNSLKGKKYDVIVRPHPQQVRMMKEKFTMLEEKYKNAKNITIQTDFSSSDTVFNADIVITDWSSIAFEYAFTTKKPVVFIDTPMKIMNPEYKKIPIEPFNIWAREEVGEIVSLEDVKNIDQVIDKVLKNYQKYQKRIEKLTNDYVYNLGKSDKIGGEYIIGAIQEKIKERKERKNEK